MWHKKPLHEFATRVIRCVQTAYCLVDFLLEVHEAYVLACTLVTVFLLLLFTGLNIKMLCFISKQGIFNCLCVNVFFFEEFRVLTLSRQVRLFASKSRTRSL